MYDQEKLEYERAALQPLQYWVHTYLPAPLPTPTSSIRQLQLLQLILIYNTPDAINPHSRTVCRTDLTTQTFKGATTPLLPSALFYLPPLGEWGRSLHALDIMAWTLQLGTKETMYKLYVPRPRCRRARR